MTHWRQKPRTRAAKGPAAQTRAAREARRTLAISSAVCELSRMGGQAAVQHALIAERTGLPVQFIQWKYPTLESFLRVADLNATAASS